MTTQHTTDLADAIAQALHHSGQPYADEVDVEVIARHDTGEPARYRVAVWKGIARWTAEDTDKGKALEVAVARMRAEQAGGAR